MHRTPSRRRSAARLLSLAAAAGLGHYFNTAPEPANPPAGGGSGGNNPPPKPEKKGDNAPQKLELTAEELQTRIDDALRAERDKQAEAKRRADADAERKAAEEKGEFKKLADQRQAENDELRLSLKRTEVREQIRDYLAEHHPAHVGAEKYVLPLVAFDAKTSADDVAKAAKAAAEQFVKDNPRQATPGKGGVNSPPPRSGVNNPRPGSKGNGSGNNGGQTGDPFANYMSNRYRGPVTPGAQQQN